MGSLKYRTEIVIDLPRERVLELFDDPHNLVEWQPGLESFEHLSGEPGQPGARSRLVFDEDGRTIEMLETITVRNLPDEFSGIYEAKGVKNWITNMFIDEGERTRWVAENEFQFSGLMRILAVFIRGSFPRQTEQYMGKFKQYADGH